MASQAAAATCPRHERELMLRGEQGSTVRSEREINCGRSVRGVLVYGGRVRAQTKERGGDTERDGCCDDKDNGVGRGTL